AIYCPQLIKCGVGATLSMESCKTILCNYWKQQGFTAEQASEKLRQFLKPGSCYDNNMPNHWYTHLFDKDGDGKVDVSTEVTCS
ncbi:hypothetical protein J7L85_01360, partial [candidate division WOR-3 bacterium]|nr:hypothetical protein [candidate division WOR-3 bacterium]